MADYVIYCLVNWSFTNRRSAVHRSQKPRLLGLYCDLPGAEGHTGDKVEGTDDRGVMLSLCSSVLYIMF